MNKSDVLKIVRRYVQKELLGDEDYPIENSQSLISDGLIDSFSLARIGVFVEEEFDLYIPDKDLTVEKMDTINQLVDKIISSDSRK